jgi:hypothetical protein
MPVLEVAAREENAPPIAMVAVTATTINDNVQSRCQWPLSNRCTRFEYFGICLGVNFFIHL